MSDIPAEPKKFKHMLAHYSLLRRLVRTLWARRAARALGLALLISAGAWATYRYTVQVEINAMRQSAAHRLDVYESALTSELTRYDYLPTLLSLNADVIAMLRDPANQALVARVNRYLEAVNDDARSSALYVMDTRGNTLAASNWNQTATFVGSNFSFRPYFIDAMRHDHGRFYGLGTVSKEAGYFYAERIYADGRLLGVATLKINLDRIESVWQQGAEPVLAADANGVIFLTSLPALKFKTLHPLSRQAKAVITAIHQYDAPGALEPAGLSLVRTLEPTASIEAVARDNPLAANIRAPHPFKAEFLAVSRPVSGTNWRIIVLSDIAPARAIARSMALGAALSLAFIAALVLNILQRRRIVAQRLAIREALQQLNDGLERKVARRTEALSRANRSLKDEVSKHKHTEALLKAALEELVQAGKMAALGQMSAGITHELNQPLAALRTLSDNALTFLQRGRTNDTEANLQMISELIERMGKITSQLKRFARKSPPQLQPVAVRTAISNALFLIELRLRKDNVELALDEWGDDIEVLADANRLEQVLVNLFTNALDAMAQSPVRRLAVSVRAGHDETVISVSDTGTGISESVRSRLFEPFFTTKEQGAGLGLGLAISAGIVREFGGTLKAANLPSGGAEFTIHLRTVVAGVNDV